MLKHTQGRECPSCAEKLASAHALMRLWFLEMVKPVFPTVHVCWAFRDKASQDQAVREKKSKTPWPTSKHNKSLPDGTPCSEALDLFVLTQDGKAEFPVSLYREIYERSRAHRCPIVWGGNFKSIKDYDHFELSQIPGS